MVEPHHNIFVDLTSTTAAVSIPASPPPSATVASVRHGRLHPPPSATVTSVRHWSRRPPRPLRLGRLCRLCPPQATRSAAAALPLSPPSNDGAVPSTTTASIRRGSRRPLRPPPSSHGRLHLPRNLHLPRSLPMVFIRHSRLHLHPTRKPPPATANSIRRNEKEGNRGHHGASVTVR